MTHGSGGTVESVALRQGMCPAEYAGYAGSPFERGVPDLQHPTARRSKNLIRPHNRQFV